VMPKITYLMHLPHSVSLMPAKSLIHTA
jgi:hypothetical protein